MYLYTCVSIYICVCINVCVCVFGRAYTYVYTCTSCMYIPMFAPQIIHGGLKHRPQPVVRQNGAKRPVRRHSPFGTSDQGPTTISGELEGFTKLSLGVRDFGEIWFTWVKMDGCLKKRLRRTCWRFQIVSLDHNSDTPRRVELLVMLGRIRFSCGTRWNFPHCRDASLGSSRVPLKRCLRP